MRLPSLLLLQNAQEPIPERLLWAYLGDLASALAHMANFGLVHLDLKGSNVFLSDDNQCVLGDFGIAHYERDGPSSADGDSTIQAPETLNRCEASNSVPWPSVCVCVCDVVKGILKPSPNPSFHPRAPLSRPTTKSDVFSLALTILEAGADYPLPRGGETFYTAMRNDAIPEAFHAHLSPELSALLRRMASRDPDKRFVRHGRGRREASTNCGQARFPSPLSPSLPPLARRNLQADSGGGCGLAKRQARAVRADTQGAHCRLWPFSLWYAGCSGRSTRQRAGGAHALAFSRCPTLSPFQALSQCCCMACWFCWGLCSLRTTTPLRGPQPCGSKAKPAPTSTASVQPPRTVLSRALQLFGVGCEGGRGGGGRGAEGRCAPVGRCRRKPLLDLTLSSHRPLDDMPDLSNPDMSRVLR